MADNAQKTHLGQTLNERMAQRALNHIHVTGKALPATVTKVEGGIMTVQFEVEGGFTLPKVTIPLAGPEYVRFPIQVGCKGVCVPNDADIGNMSGLGPNKAPGLARPGNINPLVFHPVGNKEWEKTDPHSVTLYGDSGDGGTGQVVLKDDRPSKAKTTVTISKTGVVIALAAGATLKIEGNNAGIDISNGGLHVKGDVVVDGDIKVGPALTDFLTHKHSDVMAGAAETGPPVPGS